MNVTKERWEAPRTVYEGFVVDQYVTACEVTGDWHLKPNAAPFDSSAKFVLDKIIENGMPDKIEMENKNLVTTNASGTDPHWDISYWGWEEGNYNVRYRLFQLQNPMQYIAYKEEYVTNKNLS